MKFLPFDYAVRNLGRSPLRLVATVGGSALVVLLVVAAAAFVGGMQRSLGVAPENRNVMLLGAGSEESVERSQIGAAVPGHIAAGIRGIREDLGVAYISPEVHMALAVSRTREGAEELRAIFRGIAPAAFLVHPQVEITEGRAPRAGHDEIMAGALAAQKMGVTESDLAVGKELWFADRAWQIVGRFRAPGTVMEAELWAPLTDLQVAAKRDSLSCAVVTLGEAEFADVAAWAMTRLDLELAAVPEAEYYASLRRFYAPVRMMIWGTACLMALAGLLGGLNTLYAAFASRRREVGMLQVLGFSRRAIFGSMLQESLVASAAGALVACAAAWLLLDGMAVRFSMGVFQLAVDSSAIVWGLAAGALVGLVGAVPPAVQCFRLPVAAALRAT